VKKGSGTETQRPSGPDSGSARDRAIYGQAVSLGINLAVGMAAFTLMGQYVDRKRGSGNAWTLCGVFLGLVYGAYEVWKVVRLLNAQGRGDRKDTGQPTKNGGAAGERGRTDS
jgi:hypothetical protein